MMMMIQGCQQIHNQIEGIVDVVVDDVMGMYPRVFLGQDRRTHLYKTYMVDYVLLFKKKKKAMISDFLYCRDKQVCVTFGSTHPVYVDL